MGAVTFNQSPPLVSTVPEVPSISSFTITPHHLKIMAVALAALAFFAIQAGFSWPLSLLLSSGIVAIAMISENDENWFSTDFDLSYMKLWVSLLILKPIILQIVCLALGVPLPPLAQTGLVKKMLAHPWKIASIAAIVAPFTEEVLFRGVLFDFLKSLNLGEELSMWIQAAIFGAIHLTSAVEEGAEFLVFAGLTLAGYWAASERKEANSLLCPMAVHSANNIGACIYIFLSEG